MEEDHGDTVRQTGPGKAKGPVIQNNGSTGDAVWDGGSRSNKGTRKENGSSRDEDAAILTGEDQARQSEEQHYP